MLYGRESERAAIDEVIASARSGAGRSGIGTVLVLRGEAGIGKSALLDHAEADFDPARVLRATGAEPEAGLAFAGLHQLLWPIIDRIEELPEPQRDALRGALGLAAAPPGDARFLVAAGVVSLLSEAAADGGLLCLIDDFQWFDRASADAVLFAARRLRGEGVAMLIAMRDDAGTPVRDLPDLRLTGLDRESAAELIDQPVSERLDRLVELTGGNPLALRELASILTDDQLAGRAPLPDPLPVGAGIGALFGERVAGLPERARQVLLVAAAEGLVDLDLVLRASAGSEADLAPAESAGLISLAEHSIGFRHPLMRSAVYAAAASAERRAAHGALAEALDAAGDLDRRAWHRAAATAGRDETVAAELAESAQRARARGGYAGVAAVLERSAALTPDRAVRARRLTGAATAAWLGGRPGRAETCLAEARDLAADVGDPRLVAELVQLRGRFELNAGDAAEAQRIFLEGAERARDADPGRALQMLADGWEAASYVGDVAAIVDIGRRAESYEGGDPFRKALLVGLGAMAAGDPGRGGPILREALPQVREEAADLLWAAAAASQLGEADTSAGYIIRAGRVARVSGMVGQLPVVLEFVATAERIAGRLALSAAVSEEGLTLAREAGYTNCVSAHLANLAAVAALQGREDDCETSAREALAIAIPHRIGLRASTASYALGLLDLGLGRFAGAHARFEAMAAAGPGAGHPASTWRSTPDRIEAAVGCGELDAARGALASYERTAANAATPESQALVARCRALVADDAEEGIGFLEEALRLHDSPFEEARTALLYGERLRRAHRGGDARLPLRSALEAFQRVGADPWAERAHNELRAAGDAVARPEPDALSSLTPQELRIARLVAEGVSNREVAARLFLSPRTVEYHLYKVYPKLGVSSRTELSRLVSGTQ